jgi:hypothetical protein
VAQAETAHLMNETGLTLRDVVERLDTFGDDQTIYAESPTPSARAAVATERDDGSPAPGLEYLLEIAAAREAIDVWRAWRGGRQPSLDDKLEAVLYYARNDAWLPAD